MSTKREPRLVHYGLDWTHSQDVGMLMSLVLHTKSKFLLAKLKKLLLVSSNLHDLDGHKFAIAASNEQHSFYDRAHGDA